MKELTSPVAQAAQEETTEELITAVIEGCERYRRGMADSLDAARRTGAVLLRIKKRLPHGEWETFIKNRLPFSLATAKRWMAAAKADAPKTLTMSDLEKSLALHLQDTSDETGVPNGTVASESGQCLACARKARTGQPLPAHCADCKALKPKPPTGFFDPPAPAPAKEETAPPETITGGSPAGAGREPGDDDPDPENPHLPAIQAAEKKLLPVVAGIKLIRQVPAKEIDSVGTDLQWTFETLKRWALAPRKPVKLSKVTCEHCGRPAFWASKADGSRLLVHEGGDKYTLDPDGYLHKLGPKDFVTEKTYSHHRCKEFIESKQ